MTKYRKKPVVVEAEQWTGFNLKNDNSLFKTENVSIDRDGSAFICNTLEGMKLGHKGDWLIRGIKGEFDTCKTDIFEAEYEPV